MMPFCRDPPAQPAWCFHGRALMPFVEIQMFICKESSVPTLAGMSLGGLAVYPYILSRRKVCIQCDTIKVIGEGEREGGPGEAHLFAC